MGQLTQSVYNSFSAVAGADLTASRRFVKFSSGKAVLAGANDEAIGVLDMPADNGGSVNILTAGIILVEVGTGGVTEMTHVTSDANGKAIAIGSGKDNGLALDTVAAGGVARILL